MPTTASNNLFEAFTREQRPLLVVRVGVTGHRPKDLPPPDSQKELREAIQKVLAEIKSETLRLFATWRTFYAGDKPILRLISPLAEGADRLVAEEARKLDYEIQNPLPFHQEEYEKDFTTPQSIEEFRKLQGSSLVLELDGSRENQDEAYEAVGRLVLRQSDVIIAIWNGKAPAGRGGTGQIVSEALERDIPVIRIKPWSPRHPHLCRSRLKSKKSRLTRPITLTERLINILAPPQAKEEKEKIACFLGETYEKGSAIYGYFKNFVAVGYKKPAVILHPDNTPKLISSDFIEINYKWRYFKADELAKAFATLYRGSFIATYTFGALAVLSAFFGIYQKEYHWFCMELYLIVSVLILLIRGRSLRWHERWIDYRLLAEALRQMFFLAPLGRVTPSFEVPAHLDHEDPSRTWLNWYFRASVRQAGLNKARIDRDYLRTYRRLLSDSIIDQIDYHEDNGAKMGTINHRLHHTVTAFFGITLAACLVHLAPEHWMTKLTNPSWHERIELLSSLLAIALPAFGAAVEGVLHQGEFDRISRRSNAMAAWLRETLRRVLNTPTKASSRELGHIAESFCQSQLLENADWRSVFITKDLNPP